MARDALGDAGGQSAGEGPSDSKEELAELASAQADFPSYLTDGAWNVLDHNAAMAHWFPWDDENLTALCATVLDDAECRRLWDWSPKVLAHRHGHRYELRLPHVSPETITVTSQVLLPAYRQELRYILLLPTGGSPHRR
ncbi:hypothetical protein ABTX60_01200 [Streptomyces sp. NPDC126510]|uniref:hypothetical protein n=1 Tax=Streptomyces sp. NPDC126510 TaxID=3155317 RepID=UPI0033250950